MGDGASPAWAAGGDAKGVSGSGELSCWNAEAMLAMYSETGTLEVIGVDAAMIRRWNWLNRLVRDRGVCGCCSSACWG
jgi:hypothetical protein